MWLTFAADPSFSLTPVSGTQLKLHCTYPINLRLNAWWQVYNAFQSTLQYDSANTTITPGTINAPFTDYPVSAIEGWNRYRMWWNMPAWTSGSSNLSAATFNFRTTANILSTNLNFVNITGGPVSFGLATTDDWEFIMWVTANGDILTWIYDTTYNFVTLPCIVDNDAPIFSTTIPTAWADIPAAQTISFYTYDWAGVWTSFYWYSGLNNTVLSNYVAAPISVDNQMWVNSWTIKATVSCPTCTSFGWPYILSGNALTITLWTGNGSYNRYTWDSADRWYNVSFAAPANYEIEKQVSVVLSSTDNPNESWQVHTWTSTTINFNTAVVPVITEMTHTNGSVFVSPVKTLPIKFKFSDTLAGVDTGSIKITIPTIMSGAQILLTGYVYSGSELTFTLSWWATGLGNSGWYVVEFYPKWDFPANTGITINSFVLDLAGNTGTRVTTFTTRPDCSFFGCNELLNINIMDWSNLGTYIFTGSLLVITGTNANSPYPYLTGANSDIVMCGLPWTGAVLTGNIEIYNNSWVSIKWSNYTGNKLYITGLNFIVSNWVIIVQ